MAESPTFPEQLPMSALAVDFADVERAGHFWDAPGELLDVMTEVRRAPSELPGCEVHHMWPWPNAVLFESNFGAVPASWADQVLHLGVRTPADASEFVPYGPGSWWASRSTPLVIVVRAGATFALSQLVHPVSHVEYTDRQWQNPEEQTRVDMVKPLVFPRRYPVRAIIFPWSPSRNKPMSLPPSLDSLADAWEQKSDGSFCMTLGNVGRWPAVLEVRPEAASLFTSGRLRISFDKGGPVRTNDIEGRVGSHVRRVRLAPGDMVHLGFTPLPGDTDGVGRLRHLDQEVGHPLSWPFYLRCLTVRPTQADVLTFDNAASSVDLMRAYERHVAGERHAAEERHVAASTNA